MRLPSARDAPQLNSELKKIQRLLLSWNDRLARKRHPSATLGLSYLPVGSVQRVHGNSISSRFTSRLASLLALAGACNGVSAQDAAQGAKLYMRLANDSWSCVSCHGPDPGANRNNILRAADRPETLVKVMNTVSAMGFLSSQLTEVDRADVTAFLGNIVRVNDPSAALRVWPVTLDFGRVPVGGTSARQFVNISNPSAAPSSVPVTFLATDPAIAFDHDCPASLSPGSSCEAGVTLNPNEVGLMRAAVLVSSPALSQPMVLGLIGYGSSGPLSQLAWVQSAPDVRFEAEKGGPNVLRTLTLNNPGTMPVELALTSITGPNANQFRLQGGCASSSMLQAGTQCELTVAYTPSQFAESKAVLQLRSNQGNPPALRLDGIATSPGATVLPIEPLTTPTGGGCSIGPPTQRGHDPALWLMALIAAGVSVLRSCQRPLAKPKPGEPV